MDYNERASTLPGGFDVAYADRRLDGADWIVFLHGFGSAKEHFRSAFAAPPIGRYSLLAVDLVGFGRSRGPESFGYTMAEQARAVLRLLDELDIASFHLCAHSMAGLVAMELAELEPDRVLSLVDLEGNLTPEDCFFSGKIAALDLADFETEGRRGFEAALRVAGLKDPAMAEYLDTFRLASTIALHKSAGHTVADSSTALVDRLGRIRNACYVYGARNRGVYPGEKLLQEKGVPVFYVEDAGHSMATENPAELYRIVGEFLAG